MEQQLKANKQWMGARMERKEDLRLVTGQGKYLADIVLPGMLHAVFVRSEYAHAKILGIDTSAALELPGVIAVLTGEDFRTEVKSMRQPVLLPNLPAAYPEYYALAVDKVKYHGDPVAVVIARDKYTAEDAAELVLVDYEELPVILDAEAALEPGAPQVHDDQPGNEMFAMTFTGGATEEEQRANEAAVSIAKLNLEYTMVRSPIDGRVGNILVTPGNMVKANDTQALLIITELKPIHVAFALPEQHLAEIKRRMAEGALPVEVTPQGDEGHGVDLA